MDGDTGDTLAQGAMTLDEFTAALNSEDANVVADGIKRARSTLVSQRDAPADGARVLLDDYLAASPDAAELFTIWDGLKPVRPHRSCMRVSECP